LKAVLDSNKQQTERLKEIMSAINNLHDALARLSSATDSAVTVLNTPHPSEEAIQAAADLVNSQAARLEAASDNDPATEAK
jgi:cell division protein ZapA (FtsZ GTPase activity inhibitor)